MSHLWAPWVVKQGSDKSWQAFVSSFVNLSSYARGSDKQPKTLWFHPAIAISRRKSDVSAIFWTQQRLPIIKCAIIVAFASDKSAFKEEEFSAIVAVSFRFTTGRRNRAFDTKHEQKPKQRPALNFFLWKVFFLAVDENEEHGFPS